MAASVTTNSISNTQPAKGYTIYSISISTSTNGATLVSAVAGKVIKILGYTLYSTAANNVKFTSDANDMGGAALHYFAINGATAQHISCINNQPVVLAQTNAGEAVKISLSQAQTVSGSLQYIVE
jgi:hypothetical protein